MMKNIEVMENCTAFQYNIIMKTNAPKQAHCLIATLSTVLYDCDVTLLIIYRLCYDILQTREIVKSVN